VSIFVGNLPFRAEQEDIAELFAPFGEVANCSLPLERDTGRKRGFAFVEMVDAESEGRADRSPSGRGAHGSSPGASIRPNPRELAPRGVPLVGVAMAVAVMEAVVTAAAAMAVVPRLVVTAAVAADGGGAPAGGCGGGGGYGGGERSSGASGWEDRSYGGGGDNFR
jgi:hypothetical protein